MQQSISFTIGGVPEHFNLPWHAAIQQGLFTKESITVQWREYPGGTGAMVKDLRDGSLDIAVLLTEGIVADITKGNESKIIGLYVKSPLIWGIHVAASSQWRDISALQGKRYAISRIGSGSHLMAFVDARQRGWPLSNDQLVIVGDLQGARKALASNKADIFMWEKFMTKPLVDSGEFRRVGECPTPWPCFVIVARNEIINQYKPQLQKLLQVIYTATTSFMNNQNAASIVSATFGLSQKDAADWLAITHWAVDNKVPENMLVHVAGTLQGLHLTEAYTDAQLFYEDVFAN